MLGLIWIAVVFVGLLHFSRACDFTHPELKQWAKKRVKKLGGCHALSGGEHPVKYNFPNVKVFVYQQDEEELMIDFLQYYSYVFGPKSIVVMDKDSQKLSVCQTLALYQQCGSRIVTVAGKTVISKGWTMTWEMYKHKDTLLIPLDADEFIFPFAPNSTIEAVVDRDRLWEAFQKLPIDGRKYKFQLYTSAQPNLATCQSSPITFFHTENSKNSKNAKNSNHTEFRRALHNTAYTTLFSRDVRSKTFYHSHGFLQTDDGNHYGEVKHDRKRTNDHPDVVANFSHFYAQLDAQMVHYSIGSYRGARDKYIRAAASYGFTSDSDCTTPGQLAIQYCEPCKQFINGTDQGAAYYYDACRSSSLAYAHTAVADWFRQHTLTTLELLGRHPPKVPCKYKPRTKQKGWFGLGRE